MADRRPSKNVNDVKNGKLINILTEKYLKRRSSRVAVFTSERKVALCMYVEIYPTSAKINKATAYEVR